MTERSYDDQNRDNQNREKREIHIPDALDGMRVDAGIATLLGVSRTVVSSLAKAQEIYREGKALSRSNKLRSGDHITLLLPEVSRDIAKETPRLVEGMDILFSDEDIILLNKPVGVAAHPAQGWEGPTVTAGLAACGFHISTSGPAYRQGIVHRLDVGTSGIMVVAASERAFTQLSAAFERREVQKTYHALVQGHVNPARGTINAPIGRHPGAKWRFAVTDSGRTAITHYETKELFSEGSLLSIHLETGRTHQIRVHLSALNHPCYGDSMYGADMKQAQSLGLNRQWLHAVELGFYHPNGQWMEMEAPYPEDLSSSLSLLRAKENSDEH